MCVVVYLWHTHMYAYTISAPKILEEGIGSSGAEIIGDCEQPNVDTEN